MKVAIVNKFFYPRGGDCVVAINTRRLLEQHGHQVRVFAMSYPENLDIPETGGYAPRVDFSGGMKEKLRGAARVLGKGDIAAAAKCFLDDFRPDVVHLHNVHSYLSPLIGEMAHRRGIRTVWTLHDYKLICPAYSFRRSDGQNCEDCLRSRNAVVANRCMKGSLVQSLLARLEASAWNRRRLQRNTDLFIAPSKFMRNKMIHAGFSPDKIVTIGNFVDPEKLRVFRRANAEQGDYFCYTGRLSDEKGVGTLLDAAQMAGVRLRIAGSGPLEDDLREKYASNPKIEFLGHLNAAGVASLLIGAKAAVLPSECYDNNPLGLIEALCAGVPVIGANIGGIPELIDDENGLTFESGNADELAALLRSFDRRHPFRREQIAAAAAEKFSEARHLQALLKAYEG